MTAQIPTITVKPRPGPEVAGCSSIFGASCRQDFQAKVVSEHYRSNRLKSNPDPGSETSKSIDSLTRVIASRVETHGRKSRLSFAHCHRGSRPYAAPRLPAGLRP